jgi:hypothetical protein
MTADGIKKLISIIPEELSHVPLKKAIMNNDIITIENYTV